MSKYLNKTQKELQKFLDTLGYSSEKDEILEYYNQDNTCTEMSGEFLCQNCQLIQEAKQLLNSIK